MRKKKVKDRRSLKKKEEDQESDGKRRTKDIDKVEVMEWRKKKPYEKLIRKKKKQEEATISNKWRFQNYTSGGTGREFDCKGSLKIILKKWL